MMASLIKAGETSPVSVPSGRDPVFRGSAETGGLSHADLDEDGEDQLARRGFRPLTALFTAVAAVLGVVLLLVNMLRGSR